jgi:hypothetical protein
MGLCLSGCRSYSFSSQIHFNDPKQIKKLISTGAAKPHGASFANQGLGCTSFLWRKSNDRDVFFFTRDENSYGEYRDELLSNGKILRIEEMYLDSKARNADFLKVTEQLPFVCKVTTLHRDNNAWYGSTIRWSLLLRERDGALVKILKNATETTIKAAFTTVVCSTILAEDKEYYLAIYKYNVSEFDKAFNNFDYIAEGKGLPLWYGKVVNGECKVQAECPAMSTEFLFELCQRIPNDPRDAMPFAMRTKVISSMKLTTAITQDMVIDFKPNKD